MGQFRKCLGNLNLDKNTRVCVQIVKKHLYKSTWFTENNATILKCNASFSIQITHT